MAHLFLILVRCFKMFPQPCAHGVVLPTWQFYLHGNIRAHCHCERPSDENVNECVGILASINKHIVIVHKT